MNKVSLTPSSVGIDEKTARMLEIHEKQDFNHPYFRSRLRLMLLWWVIRARMYNKAKRALDILLSLLALILLLPLILATAVAIKLDTPGPVFFLQRRVGKWGRNFYCYKFRSMVVNADQIKDELLQQNEADQIIFKIRRDPRITRVGRIIRKLSIDELPQLINVLKGDMSLVGPRPPVPREVALYEFDHYRRLDAIPGITGLQQVSGRSNLSFNRWVELDLEYIESQSFWKDLEILARTIPAVISGKGAY
jgi:exopolysaccharide biosynthesis polyprenyl glycosylphosphotransferase